MPAKAWLAIVALLFASLTTFVGWLFYVQNVGQKVWFKLELPWKLAQWNYDPIPVVWLILGAFLAGFLLATLVFGGRALASASRVRRLERELAFTSASRNTSSTSTSGSTQSDGWK
jgi:uncharacterized integral membrane protein